VKIAYKPTPEEVRKNRQREYLERYPVERQLEALTEAAQGRPEKLNELMQGLAEIRGALPYAKEGE
jgi:hypothetical protein